MTDEGYACDGCGREECDGHIEFLHKGEWLTKEYCDEHDLWFTADDERWICGETEEPAKMRMIWSTEDRR